MNQAGSAMADSLVHHGSHSPRHALRKTLLIREDTAH